jgi:hypothetical protein
LHSADHQLEPELHNVIQALEENLWRSEARYNKELVDQSFSVVFFEFGRSGKRYNRAEMLFDPQHSSEIDAKLPLPDFHARYIIKDVIQVTYISEVTYDGVVLKANRSSIWSRHDGKWLLRFHQGTPIEV